MPLSVSPYFAVLVNGSSALSYPLVGDTLGDGQLWYMDCAAIYGVAARATNTVSPSGGPGGGSIIAPGGYDPFNPYTGWSPAGGAGDPLGILSPIAATICEGPNPWNQWYPAVQTPSFGLDHVVVNCDADLEQIALAPEGLGLVFGFGQRRQQQRRQNADDGDDHQQLDKGESINRSLESGAPGKRGCTANS